MTREEFTNLVARVKALETRCSALEAAKQPAVPAAVVPAAPGEWRKVVQWQGQGDSGPILHPFTTQGPWRLRWSTTGKWGLTVWAGTPAQQSPKDMQQVVRGEGTAEGVTEVLQGAGQWNLLLAAPRGQYFDLTVEQQAP